MPSNHKYAVLRSQRMFLRLLAANTVSRFGDSLDMIAYSLMMYEVTGSASLMAVLVALILRHILLGGRTGGRRGYAYSGRGRYTGSRRRRR